MKLKKHNKDKLNINKKVNLKICIPVVVFALVCLSFAGYKLYNRHKDNKSIDNIVDSISEEAPVVDLTLEDGSEMVNPPSKEDVDDSYWKFIKYPLKNVDFTELLQRNSETVAYMVMDNTAIDYPVVQHADNDFYLNHDFNKKKNGVGWVFSDYRNRFENLKHNTVVYAHGRTDGRMFGDLKSIDVRDWYEKNKDVAIYISTPKENMLFQIVSAYTLPTETYYLTTNFGTTASHQKFIDTIMSRSFYDFKTKLDTNDKVLTLSTCLNDDVKVVVHAKLIKKQAK